MCKTKQPRTGTRLLILASIDKFVSTASFSWKMPIVCLSSKDNDSNQLPSIIDTLKKKSLFSLVKRKACYRHLSLVLRTWKKIFILILFENYSGPRSGEGPPHFSSQVPPLKPEGVEEAASHPSIVLAQKKKPHTHTHPCRDYQGAACELDNIFLEGGGLSHNHGLFCFSTWFYLVLSGHILLWFIPWYPHTFLCL